jgi:hypothetical protein
MSSKANKLFKQKLQENKKQRNSKVSVIKADQLLTIPITSNTIAKVRSHSIKINEDEVKELVQDIFHYKKSFKLNEKIEMSRYIDCNFDLSYQGARFVDDVQEACFLVC